MEHYQRKHKCKCGKEFIVDIMSSGTPHQFIAGVTCLGCAVHIMKEEEVEEMVTEHKLRFDEVNH